MSWIRSLELTETNHRSMSVGVSAPWEKSVEQNWCNTPKVSVLGLVLLLNCAIFTASHFNPAQPVPSVRACQDHARLAPASRNESFPARSGTAVGARPVLVGSAVGQRGPISVPARKLGVRLFLQQPLRLLRSSSTRWCSGGKALTRAYSTWCLPQTDLF